MRVKLLKNWIDENNDIHQKGTSLDVDIDTGKELIDSETAVETKAEVKEVEETKAVEVDMKAEMKSAFADALKELKAEEVETKAVVVEEKKVEVISNPPLFKDGSDFLASVMRAGRGDIDSRLVDKSTGYNETTVADGGYTVTTDLAKFITQQMEDKSVVAEKCSKLEIGANYTGTKIPQLDESTRSATTLYGGLRVYAPAEGVAATLSKQALTQKQIDLGKFTVYTALTDELKQDNVAFESFVRMNVGRSFAWMQDNEIVNGTLSVATAIVDNAACSEITVAGDNPTAAEWAEIYMANCNRNSAEWFLSSVQYTALLNLSNVGTLANLFYPDYTKSPNGTLFGRPINILPCAGAVGDESSVMFLDLADYLTIQKGGISEKSSIHVKFLEGEELFVWTKRWGGAPLMASTVTMPDGSVQSSFVSRD